MNLIKFQLKLARNNFIFFKLYNCYKTVHKYLGKYFSRYPIFRIRSYEYSNITSSPDYVDPKQLKIFILMIRFNSIM